MTDNLCEDDILEFLRARLAPIISETAHNFLDDGAALPAQKNERVISCDTFIEGCDFSLDLSPCQTAGYRAVVQNISDIAAMGCTPLGFLWSLQLPRTWLANDFKTLGEFCDGAVNVALGYNLKFYGGDLSLSNNDFACTITILGDAHKTPLNRRGAKPGDKLFVGRTLGASAAGLNILLEHRNVSQGNQTQFTKFLQGLPEKEAQSVNCHLQPSAQVELGQFLLDCASSCTDISDGLCRDLGRICKASKVGALINNVKDALSVCATLDQALYGGEEYALVFTIPQNDVESCDQVKAKGAFEIGAMTNKSGILELKNENEIKILPLKGYDHFASFS